MSPISFFDSKANFYGTFNEVSGELQYDAEKPEDSSISLTIQAASVDSRGEQRDGHLRSPDFLSAEEFPEITFESTTVAAGEDDTLKVTGELTFRGVSKEVTTEIVKVGEADTFRGHKAGFETRFSIDMNDYGVPFVRDSDGVGPEVELIVSLETARR